MSGLFVRSHMTAGQDGFPRREFLTLLRPLEGQWIFRSVSHVGSMDHATYSFSCKFRINSTRLRLKRSAWRVESCIGLGSRCWVCSVALAAHHEFPRNASVFVGQRHGSQLRWLALQ